MKIEDRKFAIKTATFNTIGYCISTGIPTYVDPLLKSHVTFGAREYPLGFWVLLGFPFVFVLTYFLITKIISQNLRVFLSWTPLAIAGVSVLYNFKPEFPHYGLISSIFLYSLVTLASSWIYFYIVDVKYINDASIPLVARIEKIKQSTSFWRTLTIGGGAGYFGIVVSWSVTISKLALKIVTDQGEQSLLGTTGLFQIGVFSIYIILGPLLESIKKTKYTIDLLSEIKEPNEAKSKNASNSI